MVAMARGAPETETAPGKLDHVLRIRKRDVACIHSTTLYVL